jgi:hypothetical protein
MVETQYIVEILTVELQTVNAAYFQRKISLFGFSAYLDDSTSQLIQISGVVVGYGAYRLL